MNPRVLVGVMAVVPGLLGYDVRVHVVNEDGLSVRDVDTTIAFVGLVQGSGKTSGGLTDGNGIFRASGRAEHSVFVLARKSDHYEARVDRLPNDKDLDVTVVIPRVLRPVPLFANRFSLGSGRALTIPVQNEWLGYDFEAGDWVQPIGVGKVADIRFRFKNEFKGWKSDAKTMEHNRRINSTSSEEQIRKFYGKWDAELEISFPHEGEGLFEEKRFLAYSQLKLPHAAPADGYVPTWRYTANSYSPRTTRDNVGFFLRTRVKRDGDGRMISANYAKVVGDFGLVPQGSLMFFYYFNPVPNDRNLEFDPKRNLFPPGFPGAQVGDP